MSKFKAFDDWTQATFDKNPIAFRILVEIVRFCLEIGSMDVSHLPNCAAIKQGLDDLYSSPSLQAIERMGLMLNDAVVELAFEKAGGDADEILAEHNRIALLIGHNQVSREKVREEVERLGLA